MTLKILLLKINIKLREKILRGKKKFKDLVLKYKHRNQREDIKR